jgi:hypothetical protein
LIPRGQSRELEQRTAPPRVLGALEVALHCDHYLPTGAPAGRLGPRRSCSQLAPTTRTARCALQLQTSVEIWTLIVTRRACGGRRCVVRFRWR